MGYYRRIRIMILLMVVTKEFLLNLILTKISLPAPDGTPASEDFFTPYAK